MKIFFVLFILIVNILSAYNIDQILDLYRKDSDLSNKTKNESLGSLTVYTRDDLERMQAHTLSDLLNSLRSFRYDENMLALPDVFHSDPLVYSSSIVKIFVNDHEISSAFAGSGLYLYGNIDLGFVDHVEIYEGSTSTYVNSEPSFVTIKLYTKSPNREIGTRFEAYAGSRGMNHENIAYASVQNDLQYYAYASRTVANRVKYSHVGHSLSRDYKDLHVITTMRYKNITVDAEILDHKMDPFLSMSMFATPKKGDLDYILKRISSTVTFLDDDSLKLSLSFMRTDGHLYLDMDRTIWTTNPSNLLLASDSLLTNTTDDSLNIKLEKNINYENNQIISGIQYVKKKFDVKNAYTRGVLNNNPDSLDVGIASAYIQDDYMINDNQMFTASAKINLYDSISNKQSRTFHTLQARLGYIYTTKTDSLKFFLSRMQLPTEQYVLASTDQQNIEILNINNYLGEYTKKDGMLSLGIVCQFVRKENPALLRQKGAAKYSDNYSIALKYLYQFNEFNSLKSMLYRNHYHNNVSTLQETSQGAFVRLLNSWKKFDFYNEADYYQIKYSKIKGINYNIGLKYKATQSLIFSVKGTNIFHSAAKSRYSYVKMNGSVPEERSLYISPLDQTFTVGMEYSF